MVNAVKEFCNIKLVIIPFSSGRPGFSHPGIKLFHGCQLPASLYARIGMFYERPAYFRIQHVIYCPLHHFGPVVNKYNFPHLWHVYIKAVIFDFGYLSSPQQSAYFFQISLSVIVKSQPLCVLPFALGYVGICDH